jgi:ABC-type enterobactin transport system permease subunit
MAPEAIEQLFTTSVILKAHGVVFEQANINNIASSNTQTWQLTINGKPSHVTFYPAIFEENPSLRLMNMGDPLFESLLHLSRLA